MNFNNNSLPFNHLVSLIQEPNRRDELQNAFNQKRFAKIKNVIGKKLLVLPMVFSLAPQGQIEAYTVKTENLQYDIIITGFMADKAGRKIILSKGDKDKPLTYTGGASNLYLTTDEIAGLPQFVETKGRKGIFTLPNPKIFYRGETVSLSMFKTEDTPVEDGDEIVNVVAIGYRVDSKLIADARFQEQLPSINEFMKRRSVPDTVILKTVVQFSQPPLPFPANPVGLATVKLPQVDEPLIIRGFRSNLNNAYVNFKLEGDSEFGIDQFPIWTIAQGEEIDADNYAWMQSGIYVPANVQTEFDLSNSNWAFDNQGVGDDENTITAICDTV